MSNFIPPENSVVLASDTPSGEKIVLSVNLASVKFIKPLWFGSVLTTEPQ